MAPAGTGEDEETAASDQYEGGRDGGGSFSSSSLSHAIVAEGDVVVVAANVSVPLPPDTDEEGLSLKLQEGTASGESCSDATESPAALEGETVTETAPPSQQQQQTTLPLPSTPTASSNSVVSRKFLCAAPRPDQWDELLNPVLKRLGRPRAAASTLRQTIASIQNRHAIHPPKRAGPGRKSNSVHALLFYQFLLEHVEAQAGSPPPAVAITGRPGSRNKGENDGKADDGDETTGESQDQSEYGEDNEGKDEEDDRDNDDEEKDGDESQDDNGVGDEGNPEDEDDDEEEEEDDEDNTPRGRRLSDAEEVLAGGPLTAAPAAEFAARHRKVCEVCEDVTSTQPLLLCATCPLAFHVACTRPVLDDAPSETELWQCAYCTLSTEPMYTKSRRTAAAAVRLMARYVRGSCS